MISIARENNRIGSGFALVEKCHREHSVYTIVQQRFRTTVALRCPRRPRRVIFVHHHRSLVPRQSLLGNAVSFTPARLSFEKYLISRALSILHRPGKKPVDSTSVHVHIVKRIYIPILEPPPFFVVRNELIIIIIISNNNNIRRVEICTRGLINDPCHGDGGGGIEIILSRRHKPYARRGW